MDFFILFFFFADDLSSVRLCRNGAFRRWCWPRIASKSSVISSTALKVKNAHFLSRLYLSQIYRYRYYSRRMRSDSVQSDLLLGANTTILSSKPESRNSLLTEKHHHHHLHHHRHHCHRCSDEIIRCPHHVALPDGEWSHSYSNLQSVSCYVEMTCGEMSKIVCECGRIEMQAVLLACCTQSWFMLVIYIN